MRLDRSRFPSVARFLDRLEGDVSAYPTAEAKASLLSFLDERPLKYLEGALPDELIDIVEHRPPVSSWVTEVHFRALMRAVLDEHFRGQVPVFATWAYQAQRKLFEGPLYRILFLALSPETVARTAASRYGKFHRGGVTLESACSPGRAEGVLRFPAGLADDTDHHATLAGMRAALELAGAKDLAARILESGATEARFEMTWR